jgi:hypothetical protein
MSAAAAALAWMFWRRCQNFPELSRDFFRREKRVNDNPQSGKNFTALCCV